MLANYERFYINPTLPRLSRSGMMIDNSNNCNLDTTQHDGIIHQQYEDETAAHTKI
jgi:hypothetical protein